MGDYLPRSAPPPQPRFETDSEEDDDSSSEQPQQPQQRSRPASGSSLSSSSSGSMAPPPLPRVSTPPNNVLNAAEPSSASSMSSSFSSAFPSASADQQGRAPDTRPSRSASSASRTNRLSLTLPIAPPTAYPTRPTPASSSVASFPATPVDLPSGLASPVESAGLITAIAAQERRVLELREELSRAEANLGKLKKQWANHEVLKKRAESRKTEPMRSLASKAGGPGAGAADSTPAAPDEDLNRKKALLLNQQPGSGDSSTAAQSRRRVFRGGHARALSLLSPTKTSSDSFAQPGSDELVRSPVSSQDPDSPFLQNLGRYAPMAATQLTKRASWAPQSVHQVAGLKQVAGQVAGDLTATLWTFVEDLRQAATGEELAAAGGAMRSLDANARAGTADDGQNTVRAPGTSGRPQLSRAFTADVHGTPSPAPRQDAQEHQASGGSSSKSRGAMPARPSAAEGKTGKRFSWTPLTVDSYDDNDWTSWDSPTVKSPRWSGSTVNGDIPEQMDENTTPQKRTSISSLFSPSSPSPSKNNDIAWPAALNRLTPGNIKRTATDLMKEWEKSLSPPMDTPSTNSAPAGGPGQ